LLLRAFLELHHDRRELVRVVARGELLVVDALVREHMGVHEVTHLLLQLGGAGGQTEVHGFAFVVGVVGW
jgi:hypothetical protein